VFVVLNMNPKFTHTYKMKLENYSLNFHSPQRMFSLYYLMYTVTVLGKWSM
jgi:hypothetical protein